MPRKQATYLIRINGKLVEYKDAFELQQLLLKHKNESGHVLDLGQMQEPKPFPDDKPNDNLDPNEH
jgi:hypothetical protein